MRACRGGASPASGGRRAPHRRGDRQRQGRRLDRRRAGSAPPGDVAAHASEPFGSPRRLRPADGCGRDGGRGRGRRCGRRRGAGFPCGTRPIRLGFVPRNGGRRTTDGRRPETVGHEARLPTAERGDGSGVASRAGGPFGRSVEPRDAGGRGRAGRSDRRAFGPGGGHWLAGGPRLGARWRRGRPGSARPGRSLRLGPAEGAGERLGALEIAVGQELVEHGLGERGLLSGDVQPRRRRGRCGRGGAGAGDGRAGSVTALRGRSMRTGELGRWGGGGGGSLRRLVRPGGMCCCRLGFVPRNRIRHRAVRGHGSGRGVARTGGLRERAGSRRWGDGARVRGIGGRFTRVVGRTLGASCGRMAVVRTGPRGGRPLGFVPQIVRDALCARRGRCGPFGCGGQRG